MDFVITWATVQTILIAYAPIFLYSIAEAIKATKEGEKFNIVMFFKTFIIMAVAAGFISQTTGDLLTIVATSNIVTLFIDKFLNLLFPMKPVPPTPVTYEDIAKLLEALKKLVEELKPKPSP